MLTALIAALIICGAQVGLFFVGSRLIVKYIERKQETLETRIRTELSTLVAGQPCQTAAVLLAIGQTVGREAGRSAKAAIFQEVGVAQRMTNQVGEDLAIQAIAEKQPGIGQVLAGLSRGQRKGLMGNPLVQLALQGLTGAHGPGGGPVPTNGGEYTGRKHRE